MKKQLSLILLACMLLSFFSFYSYADDSDPSNTQSSNINVSDSVSFSCIYSLEDNSILINGSVDHNTLINYGDFNIHVYPVEISQTPEEVLEDDSVSPLANASISINFKFIIKVDSIEKRFVRYAVALVDTAGNKYLAAEPLFPESPSSDIDYKKTDKSKFKGLESNNSFMIGQGEPGTVIVTVEPQKMFGSAFDGFLYPIGKTYIYISKSYILDLDRQIKNAYAGNSRVYIRYLLPTGNSTLGNNTSAPEATKYEMPNMSSEECVEYMSTFTSFLVERYSSLSSGKIYGFILGTMVDRSGIYNFCGAEQNNKKYSELLTKYMLVIGNTARALDPSLDIVIPFSEVNYYNGEAFLEAGSYRSTNILENMLNIIESGFENKFHFSIMIETTKSPLGINDDSYSNIDKEINIGDLSLHVGNVKWITNYLDSIKNRYSSVPENIMFLWRVQPNISGNALGCAYSYSYYSLLGNKRVSTFIVSFADLEAEGKNSISKDINHLFKNIDTHLGFENTNNFLSYFGEENWFDIIPNMYSGDFSIRTVYNAEILRSLPSDILGTFTYYNFSDPAISPLWSTISNCTAISSGYTTSVERALKIQIAANPSGDFSEALMLNEFPENMKYTPYISMRLGVDGQDIPDNSMFEIRIKLGTDGRSSNVVHTLQGNSDSTFYLDMTDYVVNNTTDYIRISIRCLTDDLSSYNLCLYDMKGHSAVFTSTELETLIAEEREKIQGESTDEANSADNLTFMWAIIAITFATAVFGVALFLTLKKNDEARNDSKEE